MKESISMLGNAAPVIDEEVKEQNKSEVHEPISFADGRQEIARLAYELWIARGCPQGSPDEDWFRAEELIHTRER